MGEKPISQRIAVAAGRVLVNAHTFGLIQSGGMKKGDTLVKVDGDTKLRVAKQVLVKDSSEIQQ